MASAASGVPAVGLVMPLALQQGGAENLLQNLLRAGSRSLRYTCLFLQDGPMVGHANALGYQTTVLPTTHLRDLGNYVSTVRAIRTWIVETQIDLVFSWMQKAHLYAGPAALSLGTKRMWFQHGISKGHWMDAVGSCLPADGILCCSNHVKAMQDRRLTAHPTFVCHPGVPMPSSDHPSRANARIELGLRADDHIVCMVARLERWKGAHVFIEAARLVASRFPDANFYVIGGSHPLDEPYAEEIRHLGGYSKFDGRLHLVGQRPASEVPFWHASADVIVHPATEPEPFGMAIAEALAASRAVVASRTGGISEIIEDGVSGVFVPPGDVVALADAVSGLLEDVKRRESLESAAFVRAQSFSVEAFVHRFENLLSAVLAA